VRARKPELLIPHKAQGILILVKAYFCLIGTYLVRSKTEDTDEISDTDITAHINVKFTEKHYVKYE
jgi:hypothetical protein